MAQYAQVCGLMRDEDRSPRRPRLLFLAYPFPPATAIACVRTWNIAKFLQRLRWDVTVVTPHPSVWRRVESAGRIDADIEREGIRRIFTDHRWRWLLPEILHTWNKGLTWLAGGVCRKVAGYLGVDNGIGWIRSAERACLVLGREDVDIILATGPPFAAFKLAKRLSDRFGCPYVLDYRDPWTGNPHRVRPVPSVTSREEAKLLRDCAAVTIVSPSWALAINHRFGFGPKVHVVTNGYDAEELSCIEPLHSGHFAIVYAGNFYPPKRVISPVMAALKRLKDSVIAKACDWYFHYYGGQESHVREEARRFGVTERLVLHGMVTRAEALAAVRGAGINVVITSVTEEDSLQERGIIPGKLFEIIGLGAPILLIAPSGSDIQAMVETTGLGRSFTGNDVDGIASFLRDATCGRVFEAKDVQEYAWPTLATKIDAILREAL